jgi:hypothetical protein
MKAVCSQHSKVVTVYVKYGRMKVVTFILIAN